MTRASKGPGLSRPVHAALREFVNALGKSAMYPPGHRLVKESSASLAERLSLAMSDREDLTLGITPKGLLLDGIAIKPLPVLLRDFAQRLHRKNIGTIQILEGITRDEVVTMLAAISVSDADQVVGRTGLRLQHLRIEPMVYDVLEFADSAFDTELDEIFWADLVEAAYGRRLAEDESAPTATQVAEAIAERADAGAEAARRVFEALAGFASALATRGDRTSGTVRRRFVEVLSGLSRATTTRVVAAAPTPSKRRRFLRETLSLVPPVLLMQVLESVAEADGEPISSQLRWLLGKLAGSEGLGDQPATGAFANEVLGLVEEWEGASVEDDEDEDPRIGFDPARILAIGLDIGAAPGAVCHAAQLMADRGQLLQALELLDHPGNAPAVAATITDEVLQPDLLAKLLHTVPLNYPLIGRVTAHAGAEAVGPLLDALAGAAERTTRRRLLDILVQIGPVGEQPLLTRLEGAPWYLARNILATLAELPAISELGPVNAAFGNEDLRVRHAAFKVLIRHPSSRERVVSEALMSGEDILIRAALGSLVDHCPPALVASVIVVLTHPSEELRLQAIRLLAGSNNPLVVPQLLRLVRTTGGILRRTRLQAKSRTMLAALEVLARRWSNHRPVLAVLHLAEKSSDAEIRAALRSSS